MKGEICGVGCSLWREAENSLLSIGGPLCCLPGWSAFPNIQPSALSPTLPMSRNHPCSSLSGQTFILQTWNCDFPHRKQASLGPSFCPQVTLPFCDRDNTIPSTVYHYILFLSEVNSSQKREAVTFKGHLLVSLNHLTWVQIAGKRCGDQRAYCRRTGA